MDPDVEQALAELAGLAQGSSARGRFSRVFGIEPGREYSEQELALVAAEGLDYVELTSGSLSPESRAVLEALRAPGA